MALLVLLVSAAPSFAVDLAQFQPCWRGQSGSTFQVWGFNNTPTNTDGFGGYYGPEGYAADPGYSNPNGTPQAVVSPEGAGVGWFFSDTSYSSNFSGIWDLGYAGLSQGNIALTIPNAALAPTLTRDVWVQLTEGIAADISMTNVVSVSGGSQIGTVQKVTVETHPNYTWVVSQWVFRVPANTAPNVITITGGCTSCNSANGGQNSFVESVVVDTHVSDFSLISPAGNLAIGTQTECVGLSLDPGASYRWEMKDAAGAAGTGFDQVSVTGNSNVNVLATSGNKFTVNLISLNGASAGLAANFNNNAAATWPIASATGGSVLNFNPTKFALSYTTAQFQNNLAGGLFTLALSGDSKSLNLVFAPNHSPSASDFACTRAPGLGLKLKIADLLAASTSDPDGDARALQAVDPSSSQGGTVSSDATYIYYQPANDNPDFFNYTVRDTSAAYRIGDAPRTASAKINITVVNQSGVVQTISAANGTVSITCAGIPGTVYDVQRSPTVFFTGFTVLLTTNAPPNGIFGMMDNNPGTTAFYRLVQH